MDIRGAMVELFYGTPRSHSLDNWKCRNFKTAYNERIKSVNLFLFCYLNLIYTLRAYEDTNFRTTTIYVSPLNFHELPLRREKIQFRPRCGFQFALLNAISVNNLRCDKIVVC